MMLFPASTCRGMRACACALRCRQVVHGPLHRRPRYQAGLTSLCETRRSGMCKVGGIGVVPDTVFRDVQGGVVQGV